MDTREYRHHRVPKMGGQMYQMNDRSKDMDLYQ